APRALRRSCGGGENRRRPCPLRARRATRRPSDRRRLAAPVRSLPRSAPVTFGHPLALIALAAVPVLFALWRLQERRRTADAARFSTAALIPNLLPERPGRRRYVPLALLFVCLTAPIFGAAGPPAHVTVPPRAGRMWR